MGMYLPPSQVRGGVGKMECVSGFVNAAVHRGGALGLCRRHGQCGLALWGSVLLILGGTSQTGQGGCGSGSTVSLPGPGCAGLVGGAPEVSQPLRCSVALPQEPVHGGRQQAVAPAGGLLHHLVPLLCRPEPPPGLLPPGSLQQHHPVPV